MIHFDWDILGVNLETFSPEMTPLQPCLGETPITPEQVELFTSLLQQEAAAVESSSIKPTFAKPVILPEKPQNVQYMPAIAQTQSAHAPMVQIPSTQMPTAQVSVAQMPMMQKPVISQIMYAQMPVNTSYITVKASVSAPLQPMASLENLVILEPLEIVTMPPAMENAKPSIQQPSVQIPTPQKPSVQLPTAQMPSMQMPVAQMPAVAQTQSAQTPMVQIPSTQMPTAQVSVAQMPMMQKPVIAQTMYAQLPVKTPYITVKASVSAPLQPMVSLENLESLESLEVLDHPEALETAAMPPATENAKHSVQQPSVQISTPQKPFTQVPTAQKPFIVQTQSAQMPVNTPSITVKASVSTPLQPTASLENLEALELLEVLDHLEPLVPLESLETPAMASAMENTKPSVQEAIAQILTPQKPSVQKPVAQESSTQVPTAQKPIMSQTQSAQEPVNTPSITVKAPVSAPLQPMASLEILEALELLEVLDHLEPLVPLESLETPAMAPAMENAKPSVQEAIAQILTPQKPSVQLPTATAQMPVAQASSTQTPVAQASSTQTPVAQKPLFVQTKSAQAPVEMPYISVKASVSTPLQPTASLEPLEVLDHLEPLVPLVPLENLEPLETVAMASAMENAKPSAQEAPIQIPTPQKPSVQIPTAQKPSVQLPTAQMPSMQMPAAHEPSTQMPVAQKPIISQTASAHILANTPFITVKASVYTPLQPTASLEPLESLETPAMASAMENTKPSVQEASVQILTPQKPSVQLPTATAQMPVAQASSTQTPVAQKPLFVQTKSAQSPVNLPYITIKASVSTLLQPTVSLEPLEVLEPLVPLVPLENLEPLETVAMAPAMENAKPSVQEVSVQKPMSQKPSVQLPTAQRPFTQMPMAHEPSTQMPVAQKPIVSQTASAQVSVGTPYITVKAFVSTPLQPMASLEPLENLESLEVLEPLVLLAPLENPEPLEALETGAMQPVENAKPSVQQPSVQLSMPQKSSAQVPVAQKPLTVQMQFAQESVNVPYITVKAPISTHLQPMASLEPLEALEALETPAMPYATENAKPSVQEASIQMPIIQKPIIAQTASAHTPANTPFIITVKASTFTHLQPMVSLEPLENLESLEILKPLVPLAHLEPLVPLAHLETLETLETAAMPYAMENTKLSTPMPSAQKPFTAQTQSAHVSTNTPYITIKASHSFAQKLEAPEKFTQKSPSTPVTDTPSIHAAATAISQPTDLAMPSVTPIKASPMAMSPAQILSTTVNELTAAIMVNIDENGHLGEIRLVLKPDVLDGTTILLKCDQKQISVTFFPGAESAEQLLMANQSRIAETLAATGHLPVKISIINSEGRRQIRKIA